MASLICWSPSRMFFLCGSMRMACFALCMRGSMSMSEQSKSNGAPERLMLIICQYRHLDAIVEEVNDWCQQDGGKILLSGKSERAKDGFLLTRWSGPIPALLREKFI